jgi:hypothetical protein
MNANTVPIILAKLAMLVAIVRSKGPNQRSEISINRVYLWDTGRSCKEEELGKSNEGEASNLPIEVVVAEVVDPVA